jgi:outer membrane protein OmpA-like peptidoglycan-associated protein
MTVDGGASFLFGDNSAIFSSIKSNINIGVGYNFGDYYRIYGRIGKGSLAGKEKNNSWVITESNFLQATLNLSADVIGLIAKTTDKKLELYPHVGIGQIQYKTTTSVRGEGLKQIGYNNSNNYNVKGNGFNNRKTDLTFPVGIELAYNVTERTDLYADATTYFSQSDLLDCIKSGKQRDAYSTFNIGLRYKFNKACFEPEDCVTPEEVKDAIQEALDQQKAAEEENKPACVTPEELQQAIKDAIEEYEANRPKCDDTFDGLSRATIINNNFSDISFPQNGAQKIKTQTNIDAINRASSQVNDGSAVNRVVIEGYASPEGDKEFNERLARQRAEQAAKIIQNELGEIDAERIEITTKGADWEGLYASLENSDIEGKEDIIEQLKNSENPEETMKELLKSNPQIRQLLPQLRRASIVITTVK